MQVLNCVYIALFLHHLSQPLLLHRGHIKSGKDLEKDKGYAFVGILNLSSLYLVINFPWMDTGKSRKEDHCCPSRHVQQFSQKWLWIALKIQTSKWNEISHAIVIRHKAFLCYLNVIMNHYLRERHKEINYHQGH